MAISVFPQPSAATQQDNWVQIATATPTTSVTSVSFSSIPTNYRKLWLVTTTAGIVPSAAAFLNTKINNIDSGDSYVFWEQNGATKSLDFIRGLSGSEHFLSLIFLNPVQNNLPFATFTGGFISASAAGNFIVAGNCALATSNITQIDCLLSTGNFSTNTGTFALYGTE